MSRMALIVALLCAAVLAAPAHAGPAAYTTGFVKWRAASGGFASWSLNHVTLAVDGTLQLDPATATTETDPYAAGTYYGGNFYDGGSYLVGDATSPVTTTDFTQAIASWNADTPAGSWIETLIRVRVGERWSKWFNLGVWAADNGTIRRHSVPVQGDADGYVAVDTFIAAKKVSPNAHQLKIRLFQAATGAIAAIRNASVATSTAPPRRAAPAAGNPAYWGTLLNVPECSGMVYPDGGAPWSGPTSTAMVIGFWQAATVCETGVRAAVSGVDDRLLDGYGNWPFNTAFAAGQGLEGYVRRFTKLADLEPWVAAGVPVVLTYGWRKGELTGAPMPSSTGHFAVLVGFDSTGNPIVNDPAAPTDADAQRTYLRTQLEPTWLETSGGTAFLIHPPGHTVP